MSGTVEGERLRDDVPVDKAQMPDDVAVDKAQIRDDVPVDKAQMPDDVPVGAVHGAQTRDDVPVDDGGHDDTDVVAAMTSIAVAPTSPMHREQPRPEPSKQHPAGWPWLTPREIDAALKLNSPELVEEIHALALRLLLAEEQRESRIDAKAQGLLVTAGLSLTAASTFGGVMLQHPEYLDTLGTAGAQAAIIGYGVGLVAGLVASLLALMALFVKNTFRTVDEREALAQDALEIAEREAGPAARTAYRRYMTLHYWRVWQRNFVVLESKARTIKRGQLCFIAFLVAFMAIGAIMAYASLDRFLSH